MISCCFEQAFGNHRRWGCFLPEKYRGVSFLFLTLHFHAQPPHSYSLQAIVYFSVRVEKEGLNLNVLTTELFGMSVGDYVYAGEEDDNVASKEAAANAVDSPPNTAGDHAMV